MKAVLLIIFFSLLTSMGFADQAAVYLKQADEWNKKKDFINAEKYYILAESAAENNAFYIARKGQFYHYSMKDYSKAIEAFEKAYEKGFSQSWLFVQAGNSYRYLDNLKNCEKWFMLGISMVQEKLKNPKIKSKDKDLFNENLQMLYAQYLASLLEFKEIRKAEQVGLEAYKNFPETRQNSLLNYIARTNYWGAVNALGNSEIKRAREHLEFASKLVKRDSKLKSALLSEFDILIKVLKNLEMSQKIKPVYTHRLLVILLEETDASDIDNRVTIKSNMTSKAENITEVSVKFLKNFIESSTGGKLKIEYRIEKPGIKLKRIKVDESIETSQRKNRIPDIESITEDHEEYFKDKLNNYDTIVFIWSAKDFNVANGGMHQYFLPKSKLRTTRGFVHITSERIVLNGPDLLLHEFFHTIERMADINVTHGYYSENRKYFPFWKGENGNDYYYWHLNGKSNEYYKKLNFLQKYPIRN